MRRLLVLGLLLAGCRTVVTPKPTKAPPDEVSQLQGAQSQAAALATSLCDTAGPRLSGSPGDAAAVAWAVETMTKLGLSNVHTEPVTVPKWVRGAEEAEVLAPFPQRLQVAALGGSGATPESGLEAEVVEVGTLDALRALAPGSAAGKLLFVNVVMRKTLDGAGYGEAAPVRRLAGQFGVTAGATAVLIRSVGTDANRLAHTGWQGAEPTALPVAALSNPDAELLHRLISRGPVRLKLRLTPHLEASVQGANVVGDVPGRATPEEIVLLAAHLDSWDLGTGALDDGAGVGLVLDVARAMRALPRTPRRTVRVVLYANEENGLAGARAYGEAHERELGKHVASIEADGGGDRVRTVRVLGSKAARAAFVAWAPWLLPLEVRMDEDDAEGGADTSVLRAAGVPQLDVRQDLSRYFEVHHTANDTVAQLDPVQLTQAARAFASVTWLAAEQGVDFGRVAEEKRARRH